MTPRTPPTTKTPRSPRPSAAPVFAPPPPPSRPFLTPGRIAVGAVILLLLGLTAFFAVRSVSRGDLRGQLAQYQSRAERYPEDPENYKKISELLNTMGERGDSDRYYDLYQRALKALEIKDDGKRRAEMASLRDALMRQNGQTQASTAGSNPSGGSSTAPGPNLDTADNAHNAGPAAVVTNPGDVAMKKAVEAYNIGLKYYAAGDLKRAREKFEESVAAKPDFSKGWSKLSRISLETGDLRAAMEQARKAVDTDPKNDEGYLTMGDVHRETKDYAKADEAYRKCIEVNPRNDMAYYRLAILRFRERKFGEASDLFGQSWQNNDQYYKTALNWGVTRLRLGDAAGARAKLETALRMPGIQNDAASIALASSELGGIAEQQGDRRGALVWYQKAVAAQKNPQNYFSMARIYESMGDNAKAREQYLIVTREKPDLADAWFNLGNLTYNERNFGEAFKHYQRALEANGNHLRALVQSGRCQGELGNGDGAKGFYEQAIRLEPSHPTANLELAKYWKNKGILEKAVTYGQAAAAAPSADDRVVGLNELGLIYQKFKLLEDAEKQFNQARGLSPSNPEVLGNLGRLLGEMGRFEDAITVTEALVKVSPRDWESQERLGNLFIKLGKKETAKEVFNRLLANNPNYAQRERVKTVLGSL